MGEIGMRTPSWRARLGLALAVVICLLAGAEEAGGQYSVDFQLPDLPADFDIPVEPFLSNAADMPRLREYWGIIEEHRDEIDLAIQRRVGDVTLSEAKGLGMVGLMFPTPRFFGRFAPSE